LKIDTSFNFRSDTPPEKDPDTWSPTLAEYHRLLWSKPLPDGRLFTIDYKKAPFYFHHCSDLGEFWLSSDTVVPSFRKKTIDGVAKDEMNFGGLGYTIGGMMVFPANKIDGLWTINQERGCTRSISDRFDFTVECIRRYYSDGQSPLNDVFRRYADFFTLFRDFAGYIEFFHLQDIVDSRFKAVKFVLPFEDFEATSPIPDSRDAYLHYRSAAIDFLNARNQRIQSWSDKNING
jgi:hypothetical protein